MSFSERPAVEQPNALADETSRIRHIFEVHSRVVNDLQQWVATQSAAGIRPNDVVGYVLEVSTQWQNESLRLIGASKERADQVLREI